MAWVKIIPTIEDRKQELKDLKIMLKEAKQKQDEIVESLVIAANKVKDISDVIRWTEKCIDALSPNK